MNDVFLIFAIKYKEHSSGDTMKGLDCSLLECIQLPGWAVQKNCSLSKAELHRNISEIGRMLLLYVITINKLHLLLIK